MKTRFDEIVPAVGQLPESDKEEPVIDPNWSASADVDYKQYTQWGEVIRPALDKVGAKCGEDFTAVVSAIGYKRFRITWKSRTLKGAKHLFLMLRSLGWLTYNPVIEAKPKESEHEQESRCNT